TALCAPRAPPSPRTATRREGGGLTAGQGRCPPLRRGFASTRPARNTVAGSTDDGTMDIIGFGPQGVVVASAPGGSTIT
ncbi:hypothetical protein, partial [Acinetobacter johnsonii]|uniref:hypothetical protein n=1 Tax=Acinetobacter johnsonii TaxID=40214 RepID=UPI001C08BAEA